MIEIDARDFSDKDKFYDVLNENIEFDYEVRNLDALFDQLIYVDPRLRINNYKEIYKNLGDYAPRVMRVFLDSVRMYDVNIDFISWGNMRYRSKQNEIRDFVATGIINGDFKDGDKLYDKRFFTSKFKVNPSYVENALTSMEKAHMIEKRIDFYYFTIDDNLVSRLKDEFSNRFVNDFLDDLKSIGMDIDDAIKLLEMRNVANG